MLAISPTPDAPRKGRLWPSPLLTTGSAVAILGMALLLRVVHLSHSSLWTDEVFSRYYSELFGFRFLWSKGLGIEPTPPPYYMMLSDWIRLFGDSEAALRMLSVVGSLAAIPIIFQLGRELGSQDQAQLACLILAVCPTSIYFAQEARVYALTSVASTVALLGITKILEMEAPKGIALAMYAAGAVSGIYLHATLLLFALACNLVVIPTLLWQNGAKAWRPIVSWLAANMLVAVLGTPYFAHIIDASNAGGLSWIPPLRLRDLVASVSLLVVGMAMPFPFPALPVAVLALTPLIFSLLMYPPPLRFVAVNVAIPSIFVGLVTMVSLWRPILLPRVLCWATGPFCLLAARQILQPGRLRWLLASGLTIAFGAGLVWQLLNADAAKEPWREVLREITPILRGADLVVISPRSNPLILRYYAPDVRVFRVWDEGLPSTIMTYVEERIGIRPISRDSIIRAIRTGQNVAILSNSIDLGFLALLDTDAPRKFQEKQWTCFGKPCITLVQWTGP